jgi:hypothetical protein
MAGPLYTGNTYTTPSPMPTPPAHVSGSQEPAYSVGQLVEGYFEAHGYSEELRTLVRYELHSTEERASFVSQMRLRQMPKEVARFLWLLYIRRENDSSD